MKVLVQSGRDHRTINRSEQIAALPRTSKIVDGRGAVEQFWAIVVDP